MLLPQFVTNKPIYKIIISVLELFVHDCHNSYIVIINKIHFSEVQFLWQLIVFVGEEEMGDGLGFILCFAFLFAITVEVILYLLIRSNSKSVIEKNGLNKTVQYRKVLVLKVDWYEICHTLSQAVDFENLCLNKLKFYFFLDASSYFLPLLRSSNAIQVRKMQLHLHEEISVQVFWFNIKFSPKKYDIIDFNFFFTVSDQKGFCLELVIFVDDLVRHQIVMVICLTILSNSTFAVDFCLFIHLLLGDE